MKRIWAVASGVNEDYCVLCCFSAHGCAIAYAAGMNGLSVGDQARLEELRRCGPSSRVRKERCEIEGRATRRIYEPVYLQEFELDPHRSEGGEE